MLDSCSKETENGVLAGLLACLNEGAAEVVTPIHHTRCGGGVWGKAHVLFCVLARGYFYHPPKASRPA